MVKITFIYFLSFLPYVRMFNIYVLKQKKSTIYIGHSILTHFYSIFSGDASKHNFNVGRPKKMFEETRKHSKQRKIATLKKIPTRKKNFFSRH